VSRHYRDRRRKIPPATPQSQSLRNIDQHLRSFARYGQIITGAFPVEAGDARTVFFANVYFYTNIIGLFFSLVLTGWVQSRFGPAPGMFLYALAVFATAIAFLMQPSVNVVFWSAVCIQSIAYSIHQWSRELLYTVTTAEEKFVAKGVIDTFLFRAGAATAALTLLVAAEIGRSEAAPDGLLSGAVTQMSFVTMPLAIVLMGLIWWISRRFKGRKRSWVVGG